MKKIAIDMMGGDDHSQNVIAVNYFLKNNKIDDYELFLLGQESKLKKEIVNKFNKKINFIDCTEQVSMDDGAKKMIRKKESTIYKAFILLKEKKVDAFISNGSTGAIFAGSALILDKLKGVNRPVLAQTIENQNNKEFIILDLGANVDVNAKQMLQFANIGNIYQKTIGIKNPKVSLINIGSEDEKGNILYKETFNLLKEDKNINFVGNLESRYLFNHDSDVIVCDGFTGNMILKSYEGGFKFVFDRLKKIFTSKILNKIAYVVLKKDLKRFFSIIDYKELPGGIILGVDAIVVKGHGSSNHKGLIKSIEKVYNILDNNLLEQLKKEMR